MTRHPNGDARVFPGPTLPYKLLQVALVVSGVACIGLYPLALFWRSGWAWHQGAPNDSLLLHDDCWPLRATLGVFGPNAARKAEANLSLIWFTVGLIEMGRGGLGLGRPLRRGSPEPIT
jgi:hypothetical protein